MSNYTTGELAKLCGVTVRTVQYYDTRGVLTPAALSEGGRRLYSDGDLRRMRVICFLRELGLPIETVKQILAEQNAGDVIDLLLQQQEMALRDEIGAKSEQLEKLETLRRLKNKDFPQCLACANRPFCKVCPAFNFNATGDVFKTTPAKCAVAAVVRTVYG